MQTEPLRRPPSRQVRQRQRRQSHQLAERDPQPQPRLAMASVPLISQAEPQAPAAEPMQCRQQVAAQQL